MHWHLSPVKTRFPLSCSEAAALQKPVVCFSGAGAPKSCACRPRPASSCRTGPFSGRPEAFLSLIGNPALGERLGGAAAEVVSPASRYFMSSLPPAAAVDPCRRRCQTGGPVRRTLRVSSRSTCLSSIRSRRTMSGGGRDSLSGEMSRRRHLVSRATPSRCYRRTSASTISECRKSDGPQTELASAHGITAFCYYHYWFEGRQILGDPFADVLRSGEPDFPFCLCWANENWTRVWDGRENALLLKQTYSAEDDLDHITALMPALRDRRYVRVDGKPLFLIYRSSDLPDPRTDLQNLARGSEETGRRRTLPGERRNVFPGQAGPCGDGI